MFIPPKGIQIPIYIGVRTVYGHGSGTFEFMSPIGT